MDQTDPYYGDKNPPTHDDSRQIEKDGGRRRSTRRESFTDAVFGEITESGPNYHSVWPVHLSKAPSCTPNDLTIITGRLDSSRRPYAENANRTRSVGYSSSL